MADQQSTPPLCACGCGERVGKPNNRIKNRPKWNTWIFGHHVVNYGKSYPAVTVQGRVVRNHVLRAEQALGKVLPYGAVVHHADGTKSIDSPLVICQDDSYHKLLHARMRVVKAGGDADKDALCSTCRQAKPKDQFYVRLTGKYAGTLVDSCKVCSKANTLASKRRRALAKRMNCSRITRFPKE